MHELEESVSGSLRAIGEEVAPAAGLERRVADRVSRRERRRLAVAILAVVLILLAIGIALPLSQRHRSLPVPAAGVGPGAAVSPSRHATVRVIELNGVVDPLLASLVERGVDAAGRRGDAAVLLTIDTGGGLDSSTRRVVRAVLAAKVPVVCYTGPAGAGAAA